MIDYFDATDFDANEAARPAFRRHRSAQDALALMKKLERKHQRTGRMQHLVPAKGTHVHTTQPKKWAPQPNPLRRLSAEQFMKAEAMEKAMVTMEKLGEQMKKTGLRLDKQLQKKQQAQ